jgi:geranylgeranyl diphosphate synthase, type I
VVLDAGEAGSVGTLLLSRADPLAGLDPLVEPDSLDRAELRSRVRAALAGFLAERERVLWRVSRDLGPLADSIAEFVLSGGKRLRPAFCYWGWRGAGGPDGEEIVTAAAGLELLHACALVHDDVMDGSARRRGRPAVHRVFAALHAANRWAGDAEAFGRSAAILAGDLCLVWAEEMLNTSGLDRAALTRAGGVYDEMRAELMAGQYLDVLTQATSAGSVERALRVARYKSGRYTVERPLALGGVLAGAEPATLACYAAYGHPLGEAFQLRDDVLGVFGLPAETGKPAGDDVRDGKRTVLVELALERVTPAQAKVLRGRLGDPALDGRGLADVRSIILDTGALARVESLIADRTEEAVAALDAADLDPPARDVLSGLALAASDRRH